jgi:hypothetical protein
MLLLVIRVGQLFLVWPKSALRPAGLAAAQPLPLESIDDRAGLLR